MCLWRAGITACRAVFARHSCRAQETATARSGSRTVNLVEYTGRLFRQGKASISEELAGIFERLGLSAQRWQTGMERLCGDRMLGRFIAASAVKLREIAERLGVRRLVNLDRKSVV